jgi:TonB family protein
MNFKVILFSGLVLLIFACGQQKKQEVSQSKRHKTKIYSIKKVHKPSKGDLENKETTELSSSKKISKQKIVFIPPSIPSPEPSPYPDPEPIWQGTVGMVDPSSSNEEMILEIPVEEEVLTIAEVYPEFVGGQPALIKYLHENIVYPEDAKENGLQGKVYIQFVVYKDGHLADFKILKGVYPSIDREALKAVCKMPNWIPGKNDGKEVNVRMVIPVKFWVQ